MAESYKCKRVKFPKGKQGKFILYAKDELGLTWNELAKVLNMSTRNLTDWKNEKISMSLLAVKTICKKTGAKMPENIKIMDQYWYVKKGARKGGLAVLKKYGKIGGDEKVRKLKWREWWEKEGKFKEHKISNPLPFEKPRKSRELAEFVGIVLGDGGINKNQLKVTLHCVDDLKYSKFVEKLIKKLFKVSPGLNQRKSCKALDIVISRVNLVKFCVERLGLVMGNKIKQQIDIPLWIKDKKSFRVACLRGLIDTDGCVIIHKYKSKGKGYAYKKLSFTSMSIPLLRSASEILNELDIKNRITKKGEIRVESNYCMDRYFRLVGSNNPKHLKKYKKTAIF